MGRTGLRLHLLTNHLWYFDILDPFRWTFTLLLELDDVLARADMIILHATMDNLRVLLLDKLAARVLLIAEDVLMRGNRGWIWQKGHHGGALIHYLRTA